MAQSGYTPISLYHTSTPGAQPAAGDLVSGELALNTADGKLFYKNALTNAVTNLAGLSGYSGYSGYSGGTGTNGTSGYSGYSGYSGTNGSGANIVNDVATATNEYPLFSSVITGSPVSFYTSSPNYLYKPSTGELQAPEVIANNGLLLNSSAVASNYTVATGNNALSVGPVTVNSGISVTVTSGQRWVIL